MPGVCGELNLFSTGSQMEKEDISSSNLIPHMAREVPSHSEVIFPCLYSACVPVPSKLLVPVSFCMDLYVKGRGCLVWTTFTSMCFFKHKCSLDTYFTEKR